MWPDDFAFVAVATAPSFFQSFEQLLGLDHLEREMIFSPSFIPFLSIPFSIPFNMGILCVKTPRLLETPSRQALVDRRTFRRNAETTTGESTWSQVRVPVVRYGIG